MRIRVRKFVQSSPLTSFYGLGAVLFAVSTALVLLMATAPAITAQESQGDPTTLINYPYAYDHAIGGYDNEFQRSRVLSITVSPTLRSLEGRKWGLRLRLTGMFGVHGFETLDPERIEVTTAGLIPGIEFLFRVGPTYTLRPYFDLGVATDADSNRVVWMTSLGLRTEFIIPWHRFYFGLEPGIRFSTSASNVPNDDDSFADALLRVEARHPVWFTIDDYQPDVGAYVEYGYYFDALEFSSIRGQEIEQRQRWEIGVSIGFRHERPKILLFRIPRLGIGYRFGQGASGIRIRLGGDWITPLSR